jgi:hypothetical protein
VANRRDRRGRRIGHNWWREYNVSLWFDATVVWERDCEELALGYKIEEEEYAASVPRPTLKAFLLANKGMDRQPGW